MSVFLKNVSGGDLPVNNLTILGPATPDANDGTHLDGVTIDYQLTWYPFEITTNQIIRTLTDAGSLVLVVGGVEKNQAETNELFNAIEQAITVNPKIDQFIQTRTQAILTAPNTLGGSEIVPLIIQATPNEAGKVIKLDYSISCDADNENVGFIVTRNGVILTNASNGPDNANDRWAVISRIILDGGRSQTDRTTANNFTIYDENCLNILSVYRVYVRATNNSTHDFWLNRSEASAGADGQPACLSSVHMREL